MNLKWPKFFLLLGGLIALASGCGGTQVGSSQQGDRLALNEVAEVYRLYSADHQGPPQKFKDLESLRPAGPKGVESLRSGDVVLLYGAAMPDLTEGPASTSSDKILAYDKKVPESGGDVLLLDRTIKSMSAEEFKSAPKAGK